MIILYAFRYLHEERPEYLTIAAIIISLLSLIVVVTL